MDARIKSGHDDFSRIAATQPQQKTAATRSRAAAAFDFPFSYFLL
jgi:hypothetical protein